jgi:hypothetical protein
MSEINGPFSAIGVPIADAIAEHRRAPFYERRMLTVGYAGFVLGICVWLWLGGMTGLVFFAVAGSAAFIAIAAMRSVQGVARDPWAMCGRLIAAGFFAWLLLAEVYPADGSVIAFLLQGLYWGCLGEHLARAVAAAQLFGTSSAFGMVGEDIAAGEWDWNGRHGRRRR